MRKRKLRRMLKKQNQNKNLEQKIKATKDAEKELAHTIIQEEFKQREIKYPNLVKYVFPHKNTVMRNLVFLIKELKQNSFNHDMSKMSEEEAPIFEKHIADLKKLEYGSEEYYKSLEELKPALEHHYKTNRHHPEHFKNGIKDMNLLDIIEMICDWVAATSFYKKGNIFESLEINQKRFGYGDELKSILKNTVELLIKLDKDVKNERI